MEGKLIKPIAANFFPPFVQFGLPESFAQATPMNFNAHRKWMQHRYQLHVLDDRDDAKVQDNVDIKMVKSTKATQFSTRKKRISKPNEIFSNVLPIAMLNGLKERPNEATHSLF